MLVLVGIAPAGFVVNMNASGYEITRTRDAVTNFEHYLQQHPELPQVDCDGTSIACGID